MDAAGHSGGVSGERGVKSSWQPPQAPPWGSLEGEQASLLLEEAPGAALITAFPPIVKKAQWVTAVLSAQHPRLLETRIFPVGMHVCSMYLILCNLTVVAYQGPLFMEFSRQEYWSGLPFPSSGALPNPGIKPMSRVSLALTGGFFTTEPPGNPFLWATSSNKVSEPASALLDFTPHPPD